MADIYVKMKDGSTKRFEHKGHPADWTNVIQYKGAFAVITDAVGNKTAIPASNISEIKVVNPPCVTINFK